MHIHKTEKLLTMLLAFAVLFSLIPVIALASEIPQPEPAQAVRAEIADYNVHYGLKPEMSDEQLAQQFFAIEEDEPLVLTWRQKIEAMLLALSADEIEPLLAEEQTVLFVRFSNIVDEIMTPAVIASNTLADGDITIVNSDGTASKDSETSYKVSADGGWFGRQDVTLTITNNSGETATIGFSFSLTGNYSTFTIAGITQSTSGSYSAKLDAGTAITIQLNPSSSIGAGSAVLTLSNITCVAESSAPQITLSIIGSGTVTSDGTPVSNGGSANSGTEFKATPASGSEFVAWLDANNVVVSRNETYTPTFTADTTMTAVFSSGTPYFAVGTTTTHTKDLGFQYTLTYYDVTENKAFDQWADAMNYAETNNFPVVVLLNNATLPAGDYNVPSGVTLLIPYDVDYTMYTTCPGIVYNTYVSPGSLTDPTFRTLTLETGANITVDGAISLSAHQGSKLYYNGAPSGAMSQIDMASDSSISVNENGKLYAWGFITGSGSVEIKSGATVYEDFQIADWRGGNVTTGMLDNTEKVFVFSQYYIQNVQVPMTIHAGATEMINTAISADVPLFGSGSPNAQTTFIGTSDAASAMFKLTSGSITKDYHEKSDRLIVDISSNADISVSNLVIALNVAGLGEKTIDSASYRLPLNSNITLNMKSGSKATVAQDLALLPGSIVNIEEGATCILGTGNSIYVYDADQWGGYASPSNLKLNPVAYAINKGKTRTEADLVDASLVVDGYVDASAGYVYTTSSGAAITSTGSGQVKLTAGTETETYQYSQGADSPYVAIPINSAWLKNSDGSFAKTGLSTTQPNTYTYIDGFWRCGTHSYTPVTVESTCTEAGSTTYTCSVCGDSYSETIAATGHSYEAVETPATCIKDGYTTYTCSCGHVYVENFTGLADHNYVDGVCSVCGLGENALTIDYVSLSMENSLEMNFAFLKSGISDPSGCYVEFTKVNEDGTTTATTKAYDTWKSVTIGDKEYWYAVYSGLAAKEMSDMVYAAVYDSVDGVIDENDQLISQVKADSIQTQAMRNLETAKNKPLTRTMVVDMLNYGAAAQQKFNYHTNNLANSQLTDEQKAWATASVAYEDTSKAPEGYQANVKLESNIQFMIAILGLKDSMNVEITFHDHYGTDKSYTLENITIESDDGYFYHTVEQTVIADAWQDITITVKDGETVVAEITDNIASYAARAMNKTGNELYEMIVKFSHSAKKYLHDKYNITEG